jgi:hypothetical protein
MNFLIPLGAAAGGILQGLASTRELQEQERLRKQQEFEKALSAFTQVITSPNVTPETLEYTTKLLGSVFQKHGTSLPPLPQIKPKAMRDFETQLEIFEILKRKRDRGEITDEQYYTLLSGKPDVPEQEVVMPFQFGDKTYNIRLPSSKAADIISKFMLLQEHLATKGGGKVQKMKTPTGVPGRILEDVQHEISLGNIDKARTQLYQYNLVASNLGMPLYDLIQAEIGGDIRYFLQPRNTPLPQTEKKVDPLKRAKEQGLNLNWPPTK